jgi:hypothetical protein
MADIFNGYGIGTLTGSATSPQTILSVAPNLGASEGGTLNFIALDNLASSTGPCLFFKEASDPGNFVCVQPGKTGTLAEGPSVSGKMRKVIGFGAQFATPTVGSNVVIGMSAKKTI